jgi:hypothetical protein
MLGGEASLNINAGSGCSWSAVSNDGWITIDAGGTGLGPGTVNFIASRATTARYAPARSTSAARFSPSNRKRATRANKNQQTLKRTKVAKEGRQGR